MNIDIIFNCTVICPYIGLYINIQGVGKLHTQTSMDDRGDQNTDFLLFNHWSATSSYVSIHLRTQTLLTDIENVMTI